MPAHFVRGMKCRLCGKEYPIKSLNFCTEDWGPLEVEYDYESLKREVSRALFERRPDNMWRYQELLPLEGPPTVGLHTGGTPLVKADRLAEALGVETLWVKNDAVNFPTLSFKDRVVAVALSKAKEFGYTTVGCASTGNLANSVAANAAAAGLEAYIFIPADLERAKVVGTSVYGAKVIGVRGTYDEVNRLCSQVVDRFGWGFVNINLRPFYAEGSKTMGFEIAQQLGWRTPRHVVVPMAGGADRQDSQGVQGTGDAGADRRAGVCVPRRPGDRLQSHRRRGQDRPRVAQAGQEAEHHRQVAGHWRPGRWLLRVAGHPRDGRLGRGRQRRGDCRVHDAAGPD